MAQKTYTVHCKYCGHTRKWTLAESQALNSDIESLYEVLEYDQEYECSNCGCFVRLSEALEDDVLQAEGWLI